MDAPLVVARRKPTHIVALVVLGACAILYFHILDEASNVVEYILHGSYFLVSVACVVWVIADYFYSMRAIVAYSDRLEIIHRIKGRNKTIYWADLGSYELVEWKAGYTTMRMLTLYAGHEPRGKWRKQEIMRFEQLVNFVATKLPERK